MRQEVSLRVPRTASPDQSSSRDTIARSFIIPTLAALALAACSESQTTGVLEPPPDTRMLASTLTGPAAAALDPQGKFILTRPVTNSLRRELTADEAMKLATAWSRQFASRFSKYLARTRGAPIDFSVPLTVCGRPLYARSAFAAPSDDVPAPYQRPYGPWWMVTLCGTDGSPTVSLAVSAWATELTIAEGRIRFPAFYGNEFFAIGIPVGHVGEFPSAPENAAIIAANHSKRRVAAVPDLIMPLRTTGVPQSARWHVHLDGPASLGTRGNSEITTAEWFVGLPRVTTRGLAMFVPSDSQPSAVDFTWGPAPQQGESMESYRARRRAQMRTDKLARLVDTPISFDIANSGGR